MLSISMAHNMISRKKSKETLKKSKSLILLCKFCSWAQKSPKIPPKKFALNRDLLKFFRPDLIGLTFLDKPWGRCALSMSDALLIAEAMCWWQFGRDFEPENLSGKEIKRDILSRFWSNFLSRLWSWILVKILKLKFCRDFETEFRSRFGIQVWSRFWSWNLVHILKLKLGSEFEVESWSYLKAITQYSTLGSVVPLAMFMSYLHLSK